MPSTKIQFRCWFCNRRYSLIADHVGERRICSCKRRIRVPRRSGGNSRDRTLADWCVEMAVYGTGCGLLCFFLALFTVPRIMRSAEMVEGVWLRIGGATVIGFLIGALGGEPGVNFIGRMLRERENR